MLTSCSIGILLGLLFLCASLLFTFMGDSHAEGGETPLTNIDAKEYVIPSSVVDGSALALFGIQVQQASVEEDDLLPKLPSHVVKILAFSRIAEQQDMILEVIADGKSEQGKVEVGAIVNGLLIKQVEDKKIVIEKGDEEFEVKLFHQKKLK